MLLEKITARPNQPRRTTLAYSSLTLHCVQDAATVAAQCLKIPQKVSFYTIASEESYIYSLDKLVKNAQIRKCDFLGDFQTLFLR